ncbi:hypothetical protein CDD83_9755 [Cordyceps sp. RAO-2017]|nr:hypothetical protein CDD83_9755 [Cordyceps sp. RAO-2017]
MSHDEPWPVGTSRYPAQIRPSIAVPPGDPCLDGISEQQPALLVCAAAAGWIGWGGFSGQFEKSAFIVRPWPSLLSICRAHVVAAPLAASSLSLSSSCSSFPLGPRAANQVGRLRWEFGAGTYSQVQDGYGK